MFSAEHLDPSLLRFPYRSSVDKYKSKRRRRNHTFNSRDGDDCLIEAGDKPGYFFVTAQKAGVGPGDLIQFKGEKTRYKVLSIAYYADPKDLWLGVVQKV